ncbi:MAG: DoxX family protein [Phycisphaerales bacterium]|nr:MAG: DoxX family protein [Phycisphaerales bacterium]
MNSFSQFAATVIVPTLARIVLCAAFLSVGANKVFKDHTFEYEQAQRLHELGVPLTPVNLTSWRQGDTSSPVRPASLVMMDDERRGASPPDRPTRPGPGATPVPADDPDESPKEREPEPDPDEPEPTAVGPLDPGEYRAASMHNITLMVDSAEWPYPVWMARIAAFTELVGGALLLVGLFSRIWGLGLAIAMGVAFYLVSMGVNQVHTMDPFTFAENIGAFNTLYSQAGLFVLAFGIFLTGPGPLSMDRLLFAAGRSRSGDEAEDD